MLRIYRPGAKGATLLSPEDGPEALAGAVWIDIADPLAWEGPLLKAATGIELPRRADMVEIEASSRIYREDGASVMTVVLVVGLDSDSPSTVPVSFILTRDRLVTVRYSDPQPFRSFAQQCDRLAVPATPVEILAGLLDAIVDRTADILERMAGDVDRISGTVFALRTPSGRRLSTDDLSLILRQIGQVNFVLNKVHDSLQTLMRMTSFLIVPTRDPELRQDKQMREEMKSIVFLIRTLCSTMDVSVSA